MKYYERVFFVLFYLIHILFSIHHWSFSLNYPSIGSWLSDKASVLWVTNISLVKVFLFLCCVCLLASPPQFPVCLHSVTSSFAFLFLHPFPHLCFLTLLATCFSFLCLSSVKLQVQVQLCVESLWSHLFCLNILCRRTKIFNSYWSCLLFTAFGSKCWACLVTVNGLDSNWYSGIKSWKTLLPLLANY